jgi:hypothetical protein
MAGDGFHFRRIRRREGRVLGGLRLKSAAKENGREENGGKVFHESA